MRRQTLPHTRMVPDIEPDIDSDIDADIDGDDRKTGKNRIILAKRESGPSQTNMHTPPPKKERSHSCNE